jgi:hypothetical protein
VQVYKKSVDNNVNLKGRLLYLMGATWHTKCMFDLDSDQDSFATVLQQNGIETYTFDNSLNGHKQNVDFAVKLINCFKIDYVLGYSYGCITACDVATQTAIKGVMFLDPVSQSKVNKKRIGRDFLLTKQDVRSALVENNTHIIDNVSESYIHALSNSDTFVVPAYPMDVYREYDYFKTNLLEKLNLQIFLTSQCTPESRNWFPNSTIYYPDSSHWIMLESGRYNLANDILQKIFQLKG